MHTHLIKAMHIQLKDLKALSANCDQKLSEFAKYSHALLKYAKKTDKAVYYKVRFPGDEKFKYLGGRSNQTVRNIQAHRFYREFIEVIDRDIALIEDFLGQFEPFNFSDINSKLPNVYRNSYAESATSGKRKALEWKTKKEKYKANKPIIRPEELTQPTIDGKYVRSKAEALIYNYLYEAGYTFVYELPLEGTTRLFYPDFTILSEIDFKSETRIEHHGMLGDMGYRKNAEDREADYWENGFLPNRDVYFTYDDNKGVLDMSPIIEILEMHVRPTGKSFLTS